MLKALWPLLADEGRLVYATCSILPQENTQLVEAFVASEPSAKHTEITASWGILQNCGRQLLPQLNGHDGFYYAVIHKQKTGLNPDDVLEP